MNNKGFTLIELLISITILGFIMLSVLYAESLSMHQTYMNEANMVAQQVLSYEMSYAHTWANEGNISWNTNTPQQISCTSSSGISKFEPTNSSNCLSTYNIFNELKLNNNGNIANILGSQYPMKIFLYAQSSSSCQTTVTGYVFWYYNDPGLPKSITPQITVDRVPIPSHQDSNLNNYIKNTENLTNIVCS